MLVLLLAAVWGGIGSCLFVMKKISDSLFICAFDKGKAMGDASRIVLGAIIGLVVVALFVIPDAAAGGGADVTVGKVKFGPASIAFLSGLGVKAVYGAFENLVELLSGWLSGKR